MPGSWRWGIILSILIIVLVSQGGSANRGWSASYGDEVHSARLVDDSLYLLIEQDSVMYLSRVDNGSQVWRYPLPEGSPVVVPAVSGDIVVTPFGRGTAGINITDGSLMWNISVELADDPEIDGALMFLPNGSRLSARFTGAQHEELWNASLFEDLRFILPIDDLVVLGHGDGVVSALNRSDGSTEWFVIPEGVELGRPLVAGDVIYVVSGNSTSGDLNAINVGGYIEWTREIGPTEAPPLAFDGITVVTVDGLVRSYTENGTATRLNSTGLAVSDAFSADDRIYALTPSGNLTEVILMNGSAVPGWNLSVGTRLAPVGVGDGLIHVHDGSGSVIAIDGVPLQDPFLVPGSLFLAHDPPLEGYETTVNFGVGNRGTAPSSIVVSVNIDGEEFDRKAVAIGPGDVIPIEVPWKPSLGDTTVTVSMEVDGDEISYTDDELEMTTEVVQTVEEDDMEFLMTILVGFVILWGLLIVIAIVWRKYVHRTKRVGGKGEAEEDEK